MRLFSKPHAVGLQPARVEVFAPRDRQTRPDRPCSVSPPSGRALKLLPAGNWRKCFLPGRVAFIVLVSGKEGSPGLFCPRGQQHGRRSQERGRGRAGAAACVRLPRRNLNSKVYIFFDSIWRQEVSVNIIRWLRFSHSHT